MNKQTLVFYNNLELREKLIELVASGYLLFPADDPHLAMHGIRAFYDFKEFAIVDFQEFEIFWPQFDVAFSKNIKIISAEEYLEFLSEGPFHLVNNEKESRLGAYRYDIENRVTQIRECSIQEFQKYHIEYERLVQLFAVCPDEETSQTILECQEIGQSRKAASELIRPVDFAKIFTTIPSVSLGPHGAGYHIPKLPDYPETLELSPTPGIWHTWQSSDLKNHRIYISDSFLAPARVDSDQDLTLDLVDPVE